MTSAKTKVKDSSTIDRLKKRPKVKCVHCKHQIGLDFFRELIAKELNAEERGSIAGMLGASMRFTIGTEGGRHKDLEQPRCPCDMMTMKRAKARAHYDAYSGQCKYVPGNEDSERYWGGLEAVKERREEIKRKSVSASTK